MTNPRKQLKIILITFWVSTLLAYLSLPPASMSMMQMSEMDSHAAHHTSDHHSTMLCCEMIGTTCTSLIGYVSEFAGLFFIKGNYRIVNTTIPNQLIFLDILSPPPKA